MTEAPHTALLLLVAGWPQSLWTLHECLYLRLPLPNPWGWLTEPQGFGRTPVKNHWLRGNIEYKLAYNTFASISPVADFELAFHTKTSPFVMSSLMWQSLHFRNCSVFLKYIYAKIMTTILTILLTTLSLQVIDNLYHKSCPNSTFSSDLSCCCHSECHSPLAGSCNYPFRCCRNLLLWSFQLQFHIIDGFIHV